MSELTYHGLGFCQRATGDSEFKSNSLNSKDIPRRWNGWQRTIQTLDWHELELPSERGCCGLAGALQPLQILRQEPLRLSP